MERFAQNAPDDVVTLAVLAWAMRAADQIAAGERAEPTARSGPAPPAPPPRPAASPASLVVPIACRFPFTSARHGRAVPLDGSAA